MIQARQFTGPFLFIRGSQRHKNENKRKDGLSDKGLQHFPLSKAVAPCHGRAGMWPVDTSMKSTADPRIPPIIWKIMYNRASLPPIPPEQYMPSVIAGFIWHPDIPPIAYAMATTDSPKAMATPRYPPRW